MLTRRQALAMSSPGLVVLLAGLSWWAVDRLVQARPRWRL